MVFRNPAQMAEEPSMPTWCRLGAPQPNPIANRPSRLPRAPGNVKSEFETRNVELKTTRGHIAPGEKQFVNLKRDVGNPLCSQRPLVQKQFVNLKIGVGNLMCSQHPWSRNNTYISTWTSETLCVHTALGSNPLRAKSWNPSHRNTQTNDTN